MALSWIHNGVRVFEDESQKIEEVTTVVAQEITPAIQPELPSGPNEVALGTDTVTIAKGE